MQVRLFDLLRREFSPISVDFDDVPVDGLDAPRKCVRLLDCICMNVSCHLGGYRLVMRRFGYRDPQPFKRVAWEAVAEGKLLEFPCLGKPPKRVVRLIVGLAICGPISPPEAELVPQDFNCGCRLEFAALVRMREHLEEEKLNALGVVHESRRHTLFLFDHVILPERVGGNSDNKYNHVLYTLSTHYAWAMMAWMIRQIRGVVLSTGPASAIIEVAGFGVEVRCPSPETFVPGIEATLATHLAVKQDGMELYGFAD